MYSEIYFSASPLYMFRAAHTPIIGRVAKRLSLYTGRTVPKG